MSGRVKVYGIGSCDSCRKARRWLVEQGVEFDWLDLRESPPSHTDVGRWLDAVGAETLINRRSTTWRGLEQSERPALDSPAVIDLLVEHPTLIKRPLFELNNEFRTGFGDAQRKWLLAA